MKSTIILKGISWDHGRAFPPIVAAAQRYEETHPGVRLQWEKHSLHEFGHAPVDVLCEHYDLLIIDHPWMDYAHRRSCFLPLKSRLRTEEYQDLEENSVGDSFASYHWAGELWALPIDAACPAAFWRQDRLEFGETTPAHWSELLEWARKGRVIAPGFPPDLFLHFAMLCATENARCGKSPESFAPDELALASLDHLREFFSHLPHAVFEMNPIAVHERLASVEGRGPDYCPFAYIYSNYGRQGYGPHVLTFGDLPQGPSGKSLRSVIGGTGLAVSTKGKHLETAVDFARFAASEPVQRTFYTHAGGQPAHLGAWTDPFNNQLTNGFFRAVAPPMKRAWTRPRFEHYPRIQEEAGVCLRDWLRNGGSPLSCLASLNRVWRSHYPKDNESPDL